MGPERSEEEQLQIEEATARFIRTWSPLLKEAVPRLNESLEKITAEVLGDAVKRLTPLAAHLHMRPDVLIEELAIFLRVLRVEGNLKGLAQLKRDGF